MLAVMLLVVGIISRIIVHQPNFTPVLALALFGGVYLPRKYAVIVPIALMMLSDLILGLHDVIIFTWGSVALISLLGVAMKSRKNIFSGVFASVTAAIAFFVITNLGVWLTGWYPMTFKGLADCYFMAIPFFRSTLLSTLIYSAILFGIYEVIAFRVKNTSLARVLLTT